MRHMWSLSETESVLTSDENLAVVHTLRWTKSEIADADECTNHAAHRRCVGSDLQPFVKRATLVLSKWQKPIQRIFSGSMMLATASRTAGNSAFMATEGHPLQIHFLKNKFFCLINRWQVLN